MSNIPYIAFYPGKWLGRTARLSASDRGIFITLICEMYETMQPLVLDYRALGRLCGCTPKTCEKCINILLEDSNKLVLQDGKIWNERVESEINNAKKRSKTAQVSAQKRWKKDGKDQQNQSSNDANALPPQCYPYPEPYKEKDKSFSNAKGEKKSLSQQFLEMSLDD